MTRIGVTVIGTNLVMDYGSNEAAVAAMDEMADEWQETIQETTGDYLELLERMVEQGRQRNDPTLAVAMSIEALDRLVREVRASRKACRGASRGRSRAGVDAL